MLARIFAFRVKRTCRLGLGMSPNDRKRTLASLLCSGPVDIAILSENVKQFTKAGDFLAGAKSRPKGRLLQRDRRPGPSTLRLAALTGGAAIDLLATGLADRGRRVIAARAGKGLPQAVDRLRQRHNLLRQLLGFGLLEGELPFAEPRPMAGPYTAMGVEYRLCRTACRGRATKSGTGARLARP